MRAAELVRPGMPHKPLSSAAGEEAVARLDAVRHAKGPRKTGEIRLDMQRVMQSNCAVFRTAEVLRGRGRARSIGWRAALPISASPTAR